MMDNTEREIAADYLQRQICDAVTAPDPMDRAIATIWLCIDHEPTELDYQAKGFCWCCRLLGLNWQELKSSLTEALSIKEPIPVKLKPHLSLVRKFKPAYNNVYG